MTSMWSLVLAKGMSGHICREPFNQAFGRQSVVFRLVQAQIWEMGQTPMVWIQSGKLPEKKKKKLAAILGFRASLATKFHEQCVHLLISGDLFKESELPPNTSTINTLSIQPWSEGDLKYIIITKNVHVSHPFQYSLCNSIIDCLWQQV